MFRQNATIFAAVLGLSSGAMAQSVEFGPGGVRVEPNRQERSFRNERDGISQREAVRIARRQGIAEVERVRESRGGWVIDGTDRDGDDIVVRVSSQGDVLDVRR